MIASALDHQPARAEPLHAAEESELEHVLREAAEHRAGEEDHDRDLEDPLAPVEVAELAVDRLRDRRREQIRGDDPRVVVEPAEVTDDRRQGDRHDRLVERRQQHPERQGAVDHKDLAMGAFLGHAGAATRLLAFHVGGNGLAEEFEDRRSDVADLALLALSRRHARRREDVQPLVRVVRVVGAGVVLEDVDRAASDACRCCASRDRRSRRAGRA